MNRQTLLLGDFNVLDIQLGTIEDNKFKRILVISERMKD